MSTSNNIQQSPTKEIDQLSMPEVNTAIEQNKKLDFLNEYLNCQLMIRQYRQRLL